MKEEYYCEPWYELEDEEEAAAALDTVTKSLESTQNDRIFEVLKDGSLYLNRDISSIGLPDNEAYVPMPIQIINLVQPIVDTQVAKLVQSETKVVFQTEDADFEAHQCAEDMERFCWGEFQRLQVLLKGEKAARDCCWAGDGWLKWYARNGKVCCDKPFPLEILIDDAQCLGTDPQEIYQVRYVARSWAKSYIPELADDIDELPTCSAPYYMPSADKDVVRLIEGWHLASDEGAKDGRHIFSVGRHSIVDEVWPYTVFPFSRISWAPALIGAYSDSLVSQLRWVQLEYGKIIKRIQHSLHLMSVPRIWQNANTKVSPEYDNAIGNVYKYTGQKPEQDAATSVNPELYSQADRLEQKMYLIARSNPMQSGNMPSRFDSRPALREAQEIADQPHAWLATNWERFFVDAGKQLIRVAREIVKEDGKYVAFGKANGFVERIDWADCDLEDDRFTIDPAPSSLLPTTPTGKRLVVQDLMQNGLIQDPNDAWELLGGMPDVDAYKEEHTAQKRLVDKQLYLMVKKRKAVVPDEVQDPVYCKRRVQAHLQLLLTKDNVPDDVLSLLDNYIARCDTLYLQANPPPPPPSAAPPGLPPGVMPNGGQPGPPGIPPPGPGVGPVGPVVGPPGPAGPIAA